MAETQHPPLNYEASATATHPQSYSSLPPEVSQCLKNARFLHLATISAVHTSPPTPHVSLMNYTFLPSYQDQGPVIIMTTNARSLKTDNLLHNNKVSLLVHDWVSHRPPTASDVSGQRSGSPPAAATRSSLATLLLNINTSSLSSISTTIAGEARFLEQGSEEEKWCKETHLANNTFGDQAREEAGLFGGQPPNPEGSSSCYIAGEDVRVVLVQVREGRIADWKGGIKDWIVVDGPRSISGNGLTDARGRATGEGLVNGIID
jgi:Pyridoxamine 5'-phosphate oxidase